MQPHAALIRNARLSDKMITMNLVNKVYSECEGHIWVKGHRRLSDELFETYCTKQQLKIAEIGDIIVGCVVISRINDVTELSMLVVRPEFRNQGIGNTLIQFVLDAAKENGSYCVRLMLLYPKCQDDPWKTKLKSWYSKLGFEYVKDVDVASNLNPDFIHDLALEINYSVFEKLL